MPGIGQRKIEGHRYSDTISFAVISRFIPCEKINSILEISNKSSKRNRLLPAYIMIYYIIALGFYVESSSRDVLRFLLGSLRDLLPEGSVSPLLVNQLLARLEHVLGRNL
jgi:hypothetical protein